METSSHIFTAPETLFIIAPLLIPFITHSCLLYLRQTCRAIHQALRVYGVSAKTRNYDLEEDWKHFRAQCGYSVLPFSRIIGYIHPAVGARLMKFREEQVSYAINRIDVTMDCGVTAQYYRSQLYAIVRASDEFNILDVQADNINYLARLYDALNDQQFMYLLCCEGNLSGTSSFTDILQVCQRRRSLNLILIGTRQYPISDYSLKAYEPYLDLIWNRFGFAGRFENNPVGLRRAIQRQLTRQLVDDARDLFLNGSAPVRGEETALSRRRRKAYYTCHVLAYPYASRAQALFFAAEFVVDSAWLRRTCFRRVVANILSETTPTLLQQFLKIVEPFNFDDPIEIFDRAMEHIRFFVLDWT